MVLCAVSTLPLELELSAPVGKCWCLYFRNRYQTSLFLQSLLPWSIITNLLLTLGKYSFKKDLRLFNGDALPVRASPWIILVYASVIPYQLTTKAFNVFATWLNQFAFLVIGNFTRESEVNKKSHVWKSYCIWQTSFTRRILAQIGVNASRILIDIVKGEFW